MSRVLSTSLATLVENGTVRLEAPGCAVLVALVDGELHAVDDACPHRGTSLAGGLLRDGVVTCPAHLWQFDVRTGRRHDTEAAGLSTYPVDVAGETVEVTVPDETRPLSLRETLLAHAREGRTP